MDCLNTSLQAPLICNPIGCFMWAYVMRVKYTVKESYLNQFYIFYL
jgi:hypothetical protein